MSAIGKSVYHLYVEGGFVEGFSTLMAAERSRDRHEREGWNARIMKMTLTIAGPMGVWV